MTTSRLVISFVALTVTCLLAVTTAQMRVNGLVSSPGNSPPVANPDSYTVHGSLVIIPIQNDTDPDGDPVIFDGLVDLPLHGVLIGVNPGGQYQYLANPGYTGADSFVYRIRDPSSATATAAVTLNVVNQMPLANADSYNVHGSLVVIPIENDSDPDGDPFIFAGLATLPQHGVLIGVNPGGQYQYLANPGYVGSDSFTYTIRDNLFAYATGTVTINVVNQAPIANADFYNVHGSLVVITIENDSDPDGDPFIFAGLATDPQHGVLTGVNPGGQYQYVPNPGYTGSDSFTYNIRDNLFAYATGTVTLYVVGDGENDGVVACNTRIGGPVNVTNGNMYLQQQDYALPSVGPAVSIMRTYNSNSQRVGLFGRGWSSEYDESIQAYDNNLARFNQSDGRAVYLGRGAGSSGAFAPLAGDFHGTLQSGSSGFTMIMTDGSVGQFSAAGKLISLADRVGNQTRLTYDSSGKLTSVTDPFGRVLSFTTNASGQVLSVSDTLGNVATYAYGGSNQLLSVTYADNSAFHFSYDGGLRLTTVTDALGNVVESHTYDSQGRATTSAKHAGVELYTLNFVSPTQTDVTDALGRVTKYMFDKSKGRNVVTRVEGLCNCGGGAGSQVQTWTYDDQLNVTSKTDALNHLMSFTYDAQGNRLTETNSTGTITYTYNQFAEVLTRTDQMTGVTSNTYDAAGNLLTTRDALNNTTAFTYNSRGQLLTATNARGKVTTLTYDTAGNLTQSKDANNITTFYFYDVRSRLTKVRDGLSRSTLYAYDAAGRLNKVTHPDLSFVSFTYDLAGRRTAVADERSNPTTYAYDSAYRLTSITDALSHSTSYGYDAMSNLTSVTDALNRVTDYEYDDFNRLRKTIYPPATAGASRLFETFAYDEAGNVTARKDTAGRVTNYSYDDVNRPTSTTDADDRTTNFEYDALSRTTAVIDALNQRYQFVYDAVGRQTRMTHGGVSMSYQYDAVGNRTQRTDYNGTVTNYAYDNLNRLTTVSYPTRTATYAYDPLNNLTRATNEHGSIYIGYDNRYRVSSFSDPFYYGVSYNYDPTGNRTKLRLNGATYATYTYDAVNRLTNLADSANLNFPHNYDAVNRLTARSAPNGVSSNYAYDGLDRLTALNHVAGANLLIGNQYTYNDANNITNWANASGNHAYGYDAIDRLTSATNSAQPNENYAYDSVGNRTASHLSTSYGYQPFNRLANSATATYSYDNNGNLVSKIDSLGTTTFTWNEENQLTQVTLPNALTVNYKYDALGRRIQRTTSAGASERYVYDGADVLLDLNADWSVAKTYLSDLGIDNKLRQTSSTTGVSYFLTDHLGTTAALTDSAGNVVEQLPYDSFGNSSGTSLTRYGYTGRERDPDTGLLYYRARFYDPQLGRFISEDPIGLGGGINAFAYVGNHPQNAKDPSGLHEIDVHYYLTYYLALKTGCFSESDARDIANADQGTDENPATAPAFGDTERQRQVNAFYHALHPGSHLAYLQTHWAMASVGRSGNLSAFGNFLHYLQDMYSHRGFTDPKWGHSPRHGGTHHTDKTDYDLDRTMAMARSTWDSLTGFASQTGRCGCKNEPPADMWATVKEFAEASSGGFWDRRRHTIDEINPWYLNQKIRILGLSRR
ncbi:MAG TPA: Ig-like domain-containing protein [Pyrinomonadaceae bacterium]|nr:Ig-like domain-containing protein [Pyrinomonadaceae bacterium]